MHSCLIRTNVSRFAHCFRGHSIKCLVCRAAIASEGRGQVWYPDAISSWINGRNCKAQITTSIVWTMRTWLRVKRCVYLNKVYLLPRWWHVRYMQWNNRRKIADVAQCSILCLIYPWSTGRRCYCASTAYIKNSRYATYAQGSSFTPWVRQTCAVESQRCARHTPRAQRAPPNFEHAKGPVTLPKIRVNAWITHKFRVLCPCSTGRRRHCARTAYE